MHGKGVRNEQGDLFVSIEAHTYRTEDVNEFVKSCELLKTSSLSRGGGKSAVHHG